MENICIVKFNELQISKKAAKSPGVKGQSYKDRNKQR